MYIWGIENSGVKYIPVLCLWIPGELFVCVSRFAWPNPVVCVSRFAWPNPVLVACHWLHSSRTGDLDTGRVVGQTGLNRSLISNLATYVDAVNSSPAGCYGANLM